MSERYRQLEKIRKLEILTKQAEKDQQIKLQKISKFDSVHVGGYLPLTNS